MWKLAVLMCFKAFFPVSSTLRVVILYLVEFLRSVMERFLSQCGLFCLMFCHKSLQYCAVCSQYLDLHVEDSRWILLKSSG